MADKFLRSRVIVPVGKEPRVQVIETVPSVRNPTHTHTMQELDCLHNVLGTSTGSLRTVYSDRRQLAARRRQCNRCNGGHLEKESEGVVVSAGRDE
jgi:hypothetical protein